MIFVSQQIAPSNYKDFDIGRVEIDLALSYRTEVFAVSF